MELISPLMREYQHEFVKDLQKINKTFKDIRMFIVDEHENIFDGARNVEFATDLSLHGKHFTFVVKYGYSFFPQERFNSGATYVLISNEDNKVHPFAYDLDLHLPDNETGPNAMVFDRIIANHFNLSNKIRDEEDENEKKKLQNKYNKTKNAFLEILDSDAEQFLEGTIQVFHKFYVECNHLWITYQTLKSIKYGKKSLDCDDMFCGIPDI